MSTKPAIVFGPGAWHSPDCFQLVRDELEKRGFETVGVTYPTVGAEPPTKGISDDAAAFRGAVEELVAQGKQVVCVVHSYGGLVGANAVKGLGFQQRAKEGKAGGIVMFVYLAAFVTPLGSSILSMLGGNWLPWMRPEGNYVYADTPAEIFYHDVPEEMQKKAVAGLPHQAIRSFTDPVDYEPWHEIECMYFFCEGDKAIPIAVQENMAKMLPGQTHFRTTASHSPFLSQVDETVKGLELAAKVGQEKAGT
ncbi:hypothetical protein JX266_002016 [Neoarthrinium moseri]|nr:hypothetical protein JX266_002016 [Neoarthrinium moseri]